MRAQESNDPYAYNYDPDGSCKAKNYTALTGARDRWTDFESSNPLSDVQTAQDKADSETGSKPTGALMTDARVKKLFTQELGLTIIVYSKRYKDEAGTGGILALVLVAVWIANFTLCCSSCG